MGECGNVGNVGMVGNGGMWETWETWECSEIFPRGRSFRVRRPATTPGRFLTRAGREEIELKKKQEREKRQKTVAFPPPDRRERGKYQLRRRPSKAGDFLHRRAEACRICSGGRPPWNPRRPESFLGQNVERARRRSEQSDEMHAVQQTRLEQCFHTPWRPALYRSGDVIRDPAYDWLPEEDFPGKGKFYARIHASREGPTFIPNPTRRPARMGRGNSPRPSCTP